MKALLKDSYNDCRTTTGSNLRRILIDTGIKVIPGETTAFELTDYKVYKIPENQDWKIPLLSSLIEIRDERWSILFDEENHEGTLDEHQVQDIIEYLCMN